MTRAVKVQLALWPAAFVLGTGIALWSARQPLETLDRTRLAKARNQWRDAHVRDYDIHYRMHGSEYDVMVRGGDPVFVRVNGQAPRSSDWDSYSIDGLFHVLEQELDLKESTKGPFAGNPNSVLIRVRFNETWGYPERYLRSGSGGLRGAAIELERFTRTEENPSSREAP